MYSDLLLRQDIQLEQMPNVCNFIQRQVHHLVGVAVTPVVCFLGEIGESQLNLNPEEVAECFSVPLESFLDRDR